MKTLAHNSTFFHTYVILLVIEAICSVQLFAGGDTYSPRLIAMGRTFTVLSRGIDAVGTNPANLALNDRDAAVTFNLLSTGVAVGSDFINYKIYKEYFTGVPDPNNPDKRLPKQLTEQDKNKILDLFPQGLARTQASIGIQLFGFSMQAGNIGFAVVPSGKAAVNVDLAEGYLKFPLNGNINEDFTQPYNYNFNGTAFNASVTGEANFSVGYMLPVQLPNINEIAVGIGVKYLQGFGYFGTEHYNASIDVEGNTYTNTTTGETQFVAEQLNTNFDFLQYLAIDTAQGRPVGSGVGFDIGVSALVMNSFRVGLSVTDIGSIKWNKFTKAIVSKASFVLSGIGKKQEQDSLANAFKGETKDTTAFSYSLPTALHVGAAMRVDDILTSLPFRWEVAADMHVGFNNLAGNTTLAQFAFGTELDPLAGWLPLRTGITLGGREGFNWAVGFGLHFANTFDLDFATQSIALITYPESFRTLSFTMGMRFRF